MESVQVQFGNEVRNLRYDFSAMVDVESVCGGKPWGDVLYDLRRGGFSATRAVVWAGLRWEDRKLSLEDVSGMLQEYLQAGGTLQALAILINEALRLSGLFGEEKDRANPRRGTAK